MPNQAMREYAKQLWDHAANVQRSQDYVYALQLLEGIVETGDPFYTPFALAQIAVCYNQLGLTDREVATYERVLHLPEEQQQLLNPAWLANILVRAKHLNDARVIFTKIMALAPHLPNVVAGLAEISLLENNLDEALTRAGELRNRAEPGYQVLGRMICALALMLRNKGDEALKELVWVGQFFISSGNIATGAWDYRWELQPLALRIVGPPGFGIAGMVHLLFDALTGKIALPQFIEEWKKVAPTP